MVVARVFIFMSLQTVIVSGFLAAATRVVFFHVVVFIFRYTRVPGIGIVTRL